jgi:aryl-alcohol dehydrogenase-like predicted oxidoreductase
VERRDDVRYVEVAGEKLSVIGLGTWQFGSRDWGYGEDYANKTAKEIVAKALEGGVNVFDTAEVYGFGRSEKILRQALGERRDEAFIATKIMPVLPVASVVEQRARASMRRLGTNRIALYQMHWPHPVAGDRSGMTGIRRLLDSGEVRHAGVSNYGLGRWQGAERELGGPILSNQVRFNLVDPRAIADLIPFAQSEGRVIMAYSPLAQGLLGARYDRDNLPSGIARRSNPVFLPENLDRAGGLLDALREIAKSHQCKPAQVALAWVVRRPNVIAIPGASSVEQMEFNIAASEIELTASEDDQLSEASASLDLVKGVAAAREMAEGVVSSIRSRLGLS